MIQKSVACGSSVGPSQTLGSSRIQIQVEGPQGLADSSLRDVLVDQCSKKGRIHLFDARKDFREK
ncbi:MAG: hypothetical protein EBX30_16350 [Betaproteobacteria bacterium]|nr:hypothetical protein [Betaproteobacteria bacterium]